MTSKPITYSVVYPVTKSNVYTVASQSGTTPVLNNLSVSAAAAYGLRKLNQAYSGNAIRVRRSSDNAELDIGFNAYGDLNQSALTTFVGAGNGFITTIYDQSGNNRNITQPTALNQPRIISSGSFVDSINNNPGIGFDGVASTMFVNSWGTIAQPYTRNIVFKNNSAAVSSHIINNRSGTPNSGKYVDPAGTSIILYAGTNGATAAIGSTEKVILSGNFNGASSYLSKNGIKTTGNPNTNALDGVQLGSFSDVSAFASIFFYELIIFESTPSETNRQTLERNQGQYYGIVVA
jgi:hypothetical protein